MCWGWDSRPRRLAPAALPVAGVLTWEQTSPESSRCSPEPLKQGFQPLCKNARAALTPACSVAKYQQHIHITLIFREKSVCADLDIILRFLRSTNLGGKKKISACKKPCPGIQSVLYLKSALRIIKTFQVLGEAWRAKEVESSCWPPAIRTCLDTFMWSALWTETIL